MWWALVAVTVLALAAPAAAQSWQGPTRRPYLAGRDVDNFAIAVTEVCLPYVTRNARRDAWTRPRRVGYAPQPATGVLRGLTAYAIGGGAVRVGVGDRGHGRECTLIAQTGDGGAYLQTLRDTLARAPFAVAQSRFRYPENGFADRLLLCGPEAGPHLTILASTGPDPAAEGAPVILVTFLLQRDLNRRCRGAR